MRPIKHPDPSRRATILRLLSLTPIIAPALAVVGCGGGGAAAPAPPPPIAVAPAPAPAPVPVPAPVPGPAPVGQSTACTPSANAKVGKTAALVTRSHLVSGQVRLVDSCTLEITNFNYDGGGLSKVFIYGGQGGNYVNGFPIGNNLRGMVFTGQTLRVTLNSGDIDKLSGISIWCADANANFGDANFV